MAGHGSDKLERLAAAGARLRTDGGTAEVLDAFDRGGVKALLLKGRSIASWLYTDGSERPYADCDLLVAPADMDAAERTLRSLEFAPLRDRWGLAPWWYGHATAWERRRDGIYVDLHRTLIGLGVGPTTAWQVLSTSAGEVVVAGRRAPCLGLPARAMYLALHAAQHGPGTQPAIDVERALDQSDETLWRRAAALAEELGATAAFVAGLRQTEGGTRLVTALALPETRSVAAELRANTAPPLALAFEQLARAAGLRERVEIVWRNLGPTAARLRPSDPHTGASRWGFARAYVRRLLWLGRHAPRGFHAWYRAHRAARRAHR